MTGWKTFSFNLALTIFGALETFDWTAFMGETGGKVVAAVGVVNMILRALTSTSIFSKS